MAGPEPLQRMTDRFAVLVRSDWAYLWIFTGSLLETTVVPIPFELVLIPLMVACRDRLWPIATAALAGCMAGAGAGYLVGALLYEQLGSGLVSWFGYQRAFEDFTGELEQDGFWAILTVSLSPVPMQVGTVGAGFAGYSPWLFATATVLGRIPRYYGLALAIWWLGPRVEPLVRRHQRVATIAALVIAVAALALVLLV